MNTITMPFDLFQLIVSTFMVLLFVVSIYTDIWESKSGSFGDLLALLFFVTGLLGAVGMISAIGHGFYVGIGA